MKVCYGDESRYFMICGLGLLAVKYLALAQFALLSF
jgi:hypothetical protein